MKKFLKKNIFIALLFFATLALVFTVGFHAPALGQTPEPTPEPTPSVQAPNSGAAQQGINDVHNNAPGQGASPGNQQVSPGISCWQGITGGGFNVANCIVLGAAWIGYWVLWAFSTVLWIASKFLNIVIAINNSAFHEQPVVTVGWMVVRDVANIFFIFFLLIIAIATILGISSYGYKNLLWKLLVAALLVNFSLALTGLIIDASNVLGNAFYTRMGTESDGSLAGIAEFLGFSPRDISITLVSAFAPQKLFQGSVSIGSAGGTLNALFDVGVSFWAGVFLILLATLALFAAIILLIVRIITLWFLMIMSPLAFLFYVLPTTSGLANRWANSLFKNALIYPAFMFSLYIVFVAIDKNVIGRMFGENQDQLANMFADGFLSGTGSIITQKINLIMSFVFLGGLIVASVFVAVQIGGAGSSFIQQQARALGKSVQGYAGSVSRRYAGARAQELESGKTQDRHWANPMRYMMAGASGAAKYGMKVPVAGQGLRYGLQKVAGAGRNEVGELRKGIKSSTEDELKRLYPKASNSMKAAIMAELADRGKLKSGEDDKNTEQFNTKAIERGIVQLRNLGMEKEAREVERLRPDLLAQEGRVLSEVERAKLDETTARLRPGDVEKLDDAISKNKEVMDSFARTAKPAVMQKFMEEGGKLFEALQESYRDMAIEHAQRNGRTLSREDVRGEDVAEALKEIRSADKDGNVVVINNAAASNNFRTGFNPLIERRQQGRSQGRTQNQNPDQGGYQGNTQGTV